MPPSRRCRRPVMRSPPTEPARTRPSAVCGLRICLAARRRLTIPNGTCPTLQGVLLVRPPQSKDRRSPSEPRQRALRRAEIVTATRNGSNSAKGFIGTNTSTETKGTKGTNGTIRCLAETPPPDIEDQEAPLRFAAANRPSSRSHLDIHPKGYPRRRDRPSNGTCGRKGTIGNNVTISTFWTAACRRPSRHNESLVPIELFLPFKHLAGGMHAR